MFFVKLLAGSVVAPILFALVIIPFMGFLALTINRKEGNFTVFSWPFLGLLFCAQVYYWGYWAVFCSLTAQTQAANLTGLVGFIS